ncbi:MAG: alpha-hydroxy-acid oxidizing protein, partial [Ruegeria sp.]
IRCLSGIPAAVGDRIEILMDSGIRCGQDIFRALALGAARVLVGRPLVYGLGAMGEAGVSPMLELMQKELTTTMALAGKTDVATIGRDDVVTNWS